MIKTRFKELRKKHGLTQEELISQFNERYGKQYTPAAISMFENNKRLPEVRSLIDFANFYSVTLDYLLGLTNVLTTSQTNGYINIQLTESKSLNTFLHIVNDMAKDGKINPSDAMINNKPLKDFLPKYILSTEESSQNNHIEDNSIATRMYKAYQQLPTDLQKAIDNILSSQKDSSKGKVQSPIKQIERHA